MEQVKIPLPKYITMFTHSGAPVQKAMALSSKLYNSHNTAESLKNITDKSLIQAGLLEKEDRKFVLATVKKAGYASKPSLEKVTDRAVIVQSVIDDPVATLSSSTSKVTATAKSPHKRRKRKREDDDNEFLPSRPEDESLVHGSLEFNEILDEEALRMKSVIINRAPIMSAWATAVAERVGFRKEEALSIASVLTEMNAASKGVSLGILAKGHEDGLEAVKGGSQPYVDIMGRRPLYQTQNGQWRALNKGVPVEPGAAFSYICRSFRQTMPHIMGALRLLAQSYSPQAINIRAWSLYVDFRPEVNGWGQRGEVRCDKILSLRCPPDKDTSKNAPYSTNATSIIKFETSTENAERGEPAQKRMRSMTLEEFEAELDEDTTFDNFNLDVGDEVT